MAGRAGTLFPVANRGDAIRWQAQVREVLLRRVGAPLSQRHVVLAGAALVAVPLDADPLVRVLLRLIEERLEDGADLGAQLGAVVVEVDAHVGERRRDRCGNRRGRRLGDDLDRRRRRRGGSGNRRGLGVRASDERYQGHCDKDESHFAPRV